MITEETKTIVTILAHQRRVGNGLEKLSDELRERARMHDLSRFSLDEFENYVDANSIGRNYKIGSPEYVKRMAKHKEPDGCISLHFSRNPHHPEHHKNPGDMNFLDIIEMVCDWHAAVQTYKTNTLHEGIEHHRKTLNLTQEQWWLVEGIVDFLEPTTAEGKNVIDNSQAY